MDNYLIFFLILAIIVAYYLTMGKHENFGCSWSQDPARCLLGCSMSNMTYQGCCKKCR